MKRILCAVLALGMLLSCSASYAETENKIKYTKSGNPDYSNMYAAARKDNGRIIPLSSDRWDGYIYAYLPENTEFESVLLEPVTFSDVSDYWDTLYVGNLAARGVFTGFEDGTFRKDEVLTRAEMAAVFTRLFSIEPSSSPSCFSDVKNDDWHCGYIMALVGKGVFKKDERFEPDSPVTREQLIAMTCRMLEDMGYIKDNQETDLSEYSDFDSISDYAKEAYIRLISNYYILIEDNIPVPEAESYNHFFFPQRGVTRYECAEFLNDFIRSFFSQNAPAIKRDDAPDIEIPVLDGSTSTYDITQNIYWQFYLNSENHPNFPKVHSKTSNSYKRLIDGEVEMIFVPDPSEDIKNYAEEKGVKLKYIPIANEALVFFTSDSNKADNITTEQIREIYVNNGIKNWSEIGGDDAELVPYCRNTDSGSHAQMEKFILKDGEEINSEVSQGHTSWEMSSILTDVDWFNKDNPGKYAIGYSLYYYFFNSQYVLGPSDLKLMSVDGVAPSDETLENGTYPYATKYYAVIRDEENEKVEKFAELMQGEFGKQIVSSGGFGRYSE